MSDNTGLVATDVVVRFGGLTALAGLDLVVPPATVAALIGPNGAGKTTFFNVLSGFVRPSSGTVSLNGVDLLRLRPWDRARCGLIRTFQTPQLVPSITALQNVSGGIFARRRTHISADLFRLPSMNRSWRAVLEQAEETLRRVNPTIDPGAVVSSLPLGQRRFVEIARALCSDPAILLLDEPFGGLHDEERSQMATLIEGLASERTPLLLVDHDIEMVGRLATDVFVLNFGELIAHGSHDEVVNNPVVADAYLGDPRSATDLEDDAGVVP